MKLAAPLAVALLVLAPGTGEAAPFFDAYDREVGALADRVWQAGIACAGWEPAHTAIVAIEQEELGWADGRASIGPDSGLRSIGLSKAHGGRAVESLPHEVAHAWAHSRTSALSEGVAQVLAECIAQRLGLHAGTGPSLPDAVPDLRSWSPQEATPDERTAGYELSRRLARTRLLLFGPGAVWGTSAPSNLTQLRSDLQRRGPHGHLIDALLDQPTALRDFLRDEDHDDLPDGLEPLLGSDPNRWDSDGDGWWDGAQIAGRNRLVPLPATRDVLCLPKSDGWTLEDGPLAWTRTLERWTGTAWEPWRAVDAVLPPARVIRRGEDGDWWSGWGGRGGSWLAPVGKVQTEDRTCVPGGRLWVWSGEDLVPAEAPG
jgi:hypothetical protein